MTLILFAVVAPATLGFGAETTRENLLWDGFVLSGVEGKLIHTGRHPKDKEAADTNTPSVLEPKLDWGGSGWFFELSEDVNDLRAEAPAGTTLELLPSFTLEKMIADVNGRSENTYSISGWITRYKGKNFIFPNYFLPVSKIARSQPLTVQKSKNENSSTPEKQNGQPVVSEPNDVLAMPKEIMERLKTSRIIRPQAASQAKKAEKIELERDSILAGRSAFLHLYNQGRPEFVLDALGRNVRPVTFRLMPSEALELAELTQSAVPEPVRFKIAGIITKYKGEKYLLLQRAARIYSHGNFAR